MRHQGSNLPALVFALSAFGMIMLFWGTILIFVISGEITKVIDSHGVPNNGQFPLVITGAGVFVTFSLGVGGWIYSRFAARKTSFIATVTTARVKWIEQVRLNMSAYLGKANTWRHSPPGSAAADNILSELDVLGYQIRLQLNPREEIDQAIERLVVEIPTLASQPTLDGFIGAFDKIVPLTQQLLKREWDKVKDEAENGRLELANSRQTRMQDTVNELRFD